ncbi:MAG: AAA family ATPase [Thermoanaerobaculia bacterium]
MKVPYGIADFYALRTEGYLYVDRTDRIRALEDLGKALLLLRPRRFGKTLWLRTLACYYDLRTAAEHQRLFGGLAAGGEAETPLAHRYFVMTWDFSDIDPDPPPRGVNAGVSSRVERIGNEIHGYLNGRVTSFVSDYREHLPCSVDVAADAFRTLGNLLDAIRQTPYRLYLLIDEYDNFANEVMAAADDDYLQLVHTDGPFKRLFKWVKAATAGQGLERLFLTGVSPVVMSDVTSGLNILENVYLYPELADLCGFTDKEVRGLLEDLEAEQAAAERAVAWTVAEAHGMVRDWYDGYRFAPGTPGGIYNPTLVLYFLKHLQRTGEYPRQMLDANLAADEGKLEYLAETAAGKEAVIEVIRGRGPLEIEQLADRFTLRSMLERPAQDASFLGSYLYYFGMLTLQGETEFRTLLLAPPNQVVRKLYVERILRFLLPLGDSRTAAVGPVRALLRSGDLEPLLDFVESTVFATLSNRDARWANELTVKTIFLTLLWDDVSYSVFSEPELGHGYADLCLLRRPDARASSLKDLLFEFKRLSLTEVGMGGREVRAADRGTLATLVPVKKALDAAEAQLEDYRRALDKSRLGAPDLRAWAVVALGFERLVARPLGPLRS